MNKSLSRVFLLILLSFVAVQFVIVTQVSASDPIIDKKTDQILGIFSEINTIPRCSGKEKGIRNWLKKRAKANGLKFKTDSIGNVLITVPATSGYEDAETIVFQGHLDMVCEKLEGSSHDFDKDPVKLVYDGEWVHADQTTLGADNGIGIALGLALAEDKEISHPAFELLFTVSEETGLKGAKALKPSFFKGRKYISLDNETEGVFVIGSAGLNVIIINPGGSLKKTPKNYKAYSISVSGLKGGHSGLDIHKKRGNANIIMAELLENIAQKHDIRLANIEGGTAINAITRSARSLICFDPAQQETIQINIQTFESKIKSGLTDDDAAFAIQMISENDKKKSKKSYSQEKSMALFKLIATIPNGVEAMSRDFPGSVETSSNLGVVNMKAGKVTMQFFPRSATMDGLELIKNKLKSAAKAGKANFKVVARLAPWEPVKESDFLKRAVRDYKTTFGADPIVTVVHGGSECGVIANKIKGIEMFAVGATIEDLHSPSERLNIQSVKRIWDFLVAFLASSKN
ncbi:MAG: beta-Ala-His dipeptidase [Desulfobacteraceae bacterium]|nr:beta-Ala-His dipeptidase [Desulfobacteraceae bacterium]